MPSALPLLVVVTLAALLTAGAVEVARRSALRLALLDQPNARSSHEVATPRLGGLAFVPVLLGGILLVSWLADGPSGRALVLPGLAIASIGLLVAAVSAVDDVRPLPPWLRLVAHLSAGVAVVVVVGGVQVISVPPAGTIALGAVASATMTVFWIAGFINAFNFMDGIDGIAGTQALVAGAGWVIVGLVAGAPLLAWIGAVVAGTAVGFLVHNWSPARIFMGDAGSALLGFLLATVPWALGHADLWLASALMVWPFVFDTSLTMVRRAWRGERLWEAHRSHLYQRLVIAGRSHRAVTVLYGGLAALGLVCGLLLHRGPTSLAPVAVACVVASAIGLWVAVLHAERAQPRASRARSRA